MRCYFIGWNKLNWEQIIRHNVINHSAACAGYVGESNIKTTVTKTVHNWTVERAAKIYELTICPGNTHCYCVSTQGVSQHVRLPIRVFRSPRTIMSKLSNFSYKSITHCSKEAVWCTQHIQDPASNDPRMSAHSTPSLLVLPLHWHWWLQLSNYVVIF